MAVSVLFLKPEDYLDEASLSEPAFFIDLNFNQIVESATKETEEYNLTPFYYMPLHSPDAINYRHEVFEDIGSEKVLKVIKAFSDDMHEVRAYLEMTKKDYYEHQNERLFLDAASIYIKAVQQLAKGLKKQNIYSRGLTSFMKYLDKYLASKRFLTLAEQTKELEEELASIRYEILIDGAKVEIKHYKNEPNYSTAVQDSFKRFAQEEESYYHYNFRDHTSMDQVEGRILDLLAHLYSDTFTKLTTYCTEHKHFMNDDIVRFDREVHFYIAYLTYISHLDSKKLSFCYPEVDTSKAVSVKNGFDLALASKLADDSKVPVTNDFYLKGSERIIIVSGPNQGGKTTFARMFGQLHYLASLGLLTPGSEAHLYLPGGIYTHFEKEEQAADLRGKLEDDLVRAHEILKVATPTSIILINEIFTSTTLQDAILLSKRIGNSISKLDALTVWITFIDELTTLSNKTISMVSIVEDNKTATRTFKIVRKPADGLAYALSIAEKYRLSSSQIVKRIKT